MAKPSQTTLQILALLKTLPKDRIAHYASFKDTQISRFSDPKVTADILDHDMRLQYMALRNLVNDKYRRYYRLDDKLLRPKGNPRYYERIMGELLGEKKETFWSAIRTVITGR